MPVVPPRFERLESPAIAPSHQGVKDMATNPKSRVAERIAQLAETTAGQSQTAVVAGMAASLPASDTGHHTVQPNLEGTGAKIKARARPDRLKQDYLNYLFWLHEFVLDPPTEQLFFVPTKKRVRLAGLTIRSPNREHGHDYRPTPCKLFEWVLGAIEYDLSRLTFIDYGAGKGRVLLLASEHPFKAVGGIEFAEELHDDAIMNIQQYPRSRMTCRNVECVLGDASQVGPPEGEALHYFFSPFSREVFAEVLHNMVVSYRQKPRRLYVVLIDPPEVADLMEKSGVFMRLELPLQQRLKMRMFSPYEVAIYRSLA
jgi:hypothetical protein